MDNYGGCVGFSRTQGTGCGAILSRLIRMFSFGEWSHTFVVLSEDPVAGWIIIEASDTGVKMNLLSEYTLDPNIEMVLYRPKMPLRNILEGIKAVLPLNGKAYGYLKFLGFVVVWPYYMITGRRRKNPFGAGVICSELGLVYLKATQVRPDVFDKMDPNLTSPEDLNDEIDTDREHFDLALLKKSEAVTQNPD